jgi:spermidine synthase
MQEFTERDGEVIRTFRYRPESSVFFKTLRQDVAVLDTILFGRTLFLDGILQSAEKDEEIYHRMLVHTVMGHVKDPSHKNVLVLGGGEGATLREVLKWPVQKVTMIDWDKELVEYFRRAEPTWHQGAFENQRVELQFVDVFDAIEESRSYGCIIVDLVDPEIKSPEWIRLFKRLVQWVEPGGSIIINAGGVFPWDEGDVHEIEDLVKGAAIEQGLREREYSSGDIPSSFRVMRFKKWIPSFGREWAFVLLKKFE